MDDNSNLLDSLFWKHYNWVYSETKQKYYFACSKDCSVCYDWHRPGEIWKFFIFMPVHCFNCNYAGYPDEFYFFNQIVVLCDICYEKAIRRQREILRKDIRRGKY